MTTETNYRKNLKDNTCKGCVIDPTDSNDYYAFCVSCDQRDELGVKIYCDHCAVLMDKDTTHDTTNPIHDYPDYNVCTDCAIEIKEINNEKK